MPTISWTVPVETMAAVFQTDSDWAMLGFSFTKRAIIFDARNKLLNDAIMWGYTHILFLDDDTLPYSRDYLKLLLEADKDIVMWVYRWRTNTEILSIYKLWEPLEQWLVNYVPYKEIDWSWLQEVANWGCGCVLIKRDCFVDMYNKYKTAPFEFKTITYHKRGWERHEFNASDIWKLVEQNEFAFKPMGEDLIFFERARSLWYRIFAHSDVKLRHIGDPYVISV